MLNARGLQEPQRKKLKQLSILELFSSRSQSKPAGDECNTSFIADTSTKTSKYPSITKKTSAASRIKQQQANLKHLKKDYGVGPSSSEVEMNSFTSTASDADLSFASQQTSRLLQALDSCDQSPGSTNEHLTTGVHASEDLLKSVAGDSLKEETKTSSYDWFSYAEKGQSVEFAASESETENTTKGDIASSNDIGSPVLFSDESLNDLNETGIVFQDSSSPGPSWAGLPLDQLKTPLRTLPLLKPSLTHTVVIEELCIDGLIADSLSNHDCKYVDAWDQHHVRLPCSPKSLYPVMGNSNAQNLTKRWELVQCALLNNISNSYDLEEAILTYNSRYANQWSFRGLHRFFTEYVDESHARRFFEKILPKMTNLAIMLPNLCSRPIPLLCRQKSHKVTLSQHLIASLLCNAFLCTFPRRNSRQKNSEYAEYPDINFIRLYAENNKYGSNSTHQKLKTLLHYFERVTEEMPIGTVTYERRCLNEFPVWSQSPSQVCRLHVNKDGMIEDEGLGMLQVDFANKYIGGGVLGAGMVQEEIRFCVFPELIVSRLFCEKLEDNECIVITGAERYSRYTGYASSYKWVGDYEDTTDRDGWGRRRTEVVAMDALYCSRPKDQFAPSKLRRELNKAYCGFFCDFNEEHASAIATGNWGCGAFNGNPLLKGLLQLMAAAATGRDMCYFTFHDSRLMNRLHEMHKFITAKQLTISDLWHSLIKYNSDVICADDTDLKSNMDLFDFLYQLHMEYNQSTDEEDIT